MDKIVAYLNENCRSWEEAAVPRVLGGRFYQPWGINPKGEFGKRPKKAMDITLKLIDGLSEMLPEVEVGLWLTPADTYANEINGWCPEKTAAFIEGMRGYLESRAGLMEGAAEVKLIPYSEMMAENNELYRQIREQVERQMEGKPIDAKTLESARKWVNGNAETAGRLYNIERLVEAGVVIKVLKNPVKLSLGNPERDACFDGDMTHVYPKGPAYPWIPEKTREEWKKGRNNGK